MAIVSRAGETVRDILARRPEALSDSDLLRLAHNLAAFDDRADGHGLPGRAHRLQRHAAHAMYTNDGAGDGRMTPRGLFGG